MINISSWSRGYFRCILYKDFSMPFVRSVPFKPIVCRQSGASHSFATKFSEAVSQRELADLEEKICTHAANSVNDVIVKKPLSELHWLHKRLAVSSHHDSQTTLQLLLRLPSLLHPSLSELKQLVRNDAESTLKSWLEQNHHSDLDVSVNVEAIATTPIPMMMHLVEDRDELLKSLGPGLANVCHVIAVYSCKGGVGKSTVAVNLAYELASHGGRVGIVDLDLYGPSLPILVHPEDRTIRRSPLGPGMVYPITHHNVKLMSLGFVNTNSGVPGSGPSGGAAVMKGPMAGKVVAQLLKGTDWGELDVLVLDLPPGTGDVQLAVLQHLQLSGAVAVTTPSKLATADTQKGIEMFSGLGVPTLSVVENMSYFEDDSGKRHFPFGKGLSDFEQNAAFKPGNLVQLPISLFTNDANESGEPLTLVRPNEAQKELAAFRHLANHVARELLLIQYGKTESHVFVLLDDETFDVATAVLALDRGKKDDNLSVRLFSEKGAVHKVLNPSCLRCRDPKTGDILEDSPYRANCEAVSGEERKDDDKDQTIVHVEARTGKRSPSIIPTKVERRGRYGFAVEWADGATIIYSMLCIAKAAGGSLVR